MIAALRTQPGHACSVSAPAGAYPSGTNAIRCADTIEVVADDTQQSTGEMPMNLQRLLFAVIAAILTPPALAADNIKIGFPMPLSGPASVYGVPITKGAEMAVQEINASGGVLGRKLELLTRDSKASADEAVRLARELI